ncbi:hypothetical protein N9N67_05985 [Bacteriovoracaceae bacterium]|nr:hypothetical protein [Bacteriovoracaceae bacterium]
MKKSEAIIFLLSASIIALGSILISHSPLFNLSILPILNIEQDLSLFPSIVWIYLSLCFYTLYLLKEMIISSPSSKVAKLLLSFNIAILCFNFFFPIVYPRDFHPLPLINDTSHHLLSLLRQINQPIGTSPSILIVNCFVMSYLIFRDKKKVLYPLYLFLLIATYSLIFLKQNYVIGLSFSLFISFIFIQLLKKYQK